MSESIVEEINDVIKCPDCDSTDIITDETRGEQICAQCGFVIEERMINFDSELRAYNQEERQQRARTEVPSFSLSNDLSTFIGFENQDASGISLSSDKKSQFFRLRRWQSRIKNHDSKSINLNKAQQELERLSSQLDIPRNVKETAGLLYKKSLEANKIRGYPIDAMVAASLYAAARVRRVPRTLEEISSASRISKKKVAQAYRILIKRMNYKIPLTKPSDYLIRLGTELGLSGTTQQLAAELIESAEAQKLAIGKDPSGLAAAAIYLAGIIRGEKRPQKLVSEIAHVTEVTIRHRKDDLLELVNGKI